MAQNPAQAYGEDVACIVDADELFSEAEGLDVVAQDSLHAITQENFLGPGGDGRGIDVRKLIGASQDELTSTQPLIAEVLERDDRITHADVTLTAVMVNGLADVQLEITGYTAAGPFSFTRNVSDLTSQDLEAGEG
jgi:hypothetical protein